MVKKKKQKIKEYIKLLHVIRIFNIQLDLFLFLLSVYTINE